MVQIFENSHEYNYGFNTASLAYFNRYPNPFAKHVLSSDTLESYVDENGCLRTTRLVVKTGRLPSFIQPFIGEGNLRSWIVEKSVVNPKSQKLLCYCANIDHRKFIKVEEFLKYTPISNSDTLVECKVKFSSNFFGLKQRIEQWGLNKFSSNMRNSREGLLYAMNKFKANNGMFTSKY